MVTKIEKVVKLGFTKMLGECRLSVVARQEAASPATGSATRHREQQEQLLDKAFEQRAVEAGSVQTG